MVMEIFSPEAFRLYLVMKEMKERRIKSTAEERK